MPASLFRTALVPATKLTHRLSCALGRRLDHVPGLEVKRHDTAIFWSYAAARKHASWPTETTVCN